MLRLDVQATQHFQAASCNRCQQFAAGAQTQVFGKVRQDEPGLAARRQVRANAAQKPQQHTAVFVVHSAFQRRARTRR